LVPRFWLRPRCYRASLAARLRRLPAAVVALSLTLAAGGCSYQLDSMLGSSKDGGDVTGSLRPRTVAKPAAGLPPEGDLVIARAAVSEVLSKGGQDTSVPWENPKTGARGTITPIASAYSQDGLTCHDFLASYVRSGTESWMQGEACRLNQGKWEVRHLKPWQRT
jgi:surface antigen